MRVRCAPKPLIVFMIGVGIAVIAGLVVLLINEAKQPPPYRQKVVVQHCEVGVNGCSSRSNFTASTSVPDTFDNENDPMALLKHAAKVNAVAGNSRVNEPPSRQQAKDPPNFLQLDELLNKGRIEAIPPWTMEYPIWPPRLIK